MWTRWTEEAKGSATTVRAHISPASEARSLPSPEHQASHQICWCLRCSLCARGGRHQTNNHVDVKPRSLHLLQQKRKAECIQQKLCKASFTGVGVNRGFGASITCSNGLFVLMPFPPTKIQLSLKPNELITELPSSEMRRRASSLSLQEKEDGHHFNMPQCSQHYRGLK